MRGYVHCTAKNAATNTTPGSATLAFLNVDANRSFAINLNGLNTDGTTFGTATREECVSAHSQIQWQNENSIRVCSCVNY
jgi:hypothetical protein